MSSSLGSLVVKIGADISGLRGDVGEATRSLGSLQGSADGLVKGLKFLAGAVAAVGLGALVKQQMEAIDTAAKLSRQLGGTINGLKGLQLAAADAGVDSGTLTASMEALQRKLGEAARTGAGPAYEALQRLGLSARELSSMDLDERMAAVADALREKGYSAAATADALAKLGIRQGELARLMADGGDAIRGARAELIAMGAALSEVDAAKVEAAGDSMARVKVAIDGVVQRLTVKLAPMITVLADKFIELAKETGGFKEAVDIVVKAGVMGLGYLGDAVHVVEIALGASSAAGWAMNKAMAELSADGARALQSLAQGAVDTANMAIEAFNKIPGVKVPLFEALGDFEFVLEAEEHARAMGNLANDVQSKFRALREEPWPSDKAEKFFNDIQAAATQAAEATVRSRRAMDGVAGGGEGSTEADQKEAQKQREKLEQQLQTLREFAMTEEELENAKHARRLEQLNEALDQELLALTEYHDISQGLEREHAKALEKIRGDSAERLQRVQGMLIDSLGSMSRGLSQSINAIAQQAHNNYMALAQSANAGDRKRAVDAERHAREMFDINKGFAIADALVQGAMGVAKTLGAYPYPENLIMAAPHAAAAAAQVATISAQQFQGSGGTVRAPSGGGVARVSSGTSSPVGSAHGGAITGGSTQGVTINMGDGDVFSRRSVLSMIDGINEAVGDGARILVVQ